MVAIFELECCRREIVFGRYKGNTQSSPSKERCPFGCPQRWMCGRQERVKLSFKRYQSEDHTSDELLRTCMPIWDLHVRQIRGF